MVLLLTTVVGSSQWKTASDGGDLFQKALPLQMIHLGQQTGVLKIVIFLPRHRDIVTIFTAPVAGCHASRQCETAAVQPVWN